MNLQRVSSIFSRGIAFSKYNNKLLPTTKVRISLQCSQIRLVSTVEAKTAENGTSLVKKLLNKLPFVNIDKLKIKASAYLLYEEIADKINYIDFFERFDLPDTFYSWFVITELHIWMLSARAMAEGDDGRCLRNALVEALWADVALRVKKLGAGNPSEMRSQVSELSEQLQAALIAYDEGLQSDDVVLAGALWRRLYQQCYAEPAHLENLVKYVRKQITILDNLSRHQIFDEKTVNWQILKNR